MKKSRHYPKKRQGCSSLAQISVICGNRWRQSGPGSGKGYPIRMRIPRQGKMLLKRFPLGMKGRMAIWACMRELRHLSGETCQKKNKNGRRRCLPWKNYGKKVYNKPEPGWSRQRRGIRGAGTGRTEKRNGEACWRDWKNSFGSAALSWMPCPAVRRPCSSR